MAKNGYWVVCYKSVSNPATVSEYSKLAATAPKALGGRVIAGGNPAKTHEAGVDQSVVIVELMSVRAHHGQTGRNRITSCLPTIRELSRGGSNRSPNHS